jgi:predicted Zn-dependent peptidase
MAAATRRDILRMLGSVGAVTCLPGAIVAQPLRSSFTLANGLRVHCARVPSAYCSAALTLRSRDIMGPGGVAHLLEHTSFTGAAGPLTAKEVKARHKALLQDSNATTAPGIIKWHGSFLTRHMSDVLDLLAITSLDQKFDVETVASEARVVLQELYLDKYDSGAALKKRFNASLLGADHPYAKETTDAEIAKARTPPDKLAAELRAYAETIRLPANMDLFLVGRLDIEEIKPLVAQNFERFAFATGPVLLVPRAQVTRSYRTMSGRSQQLKRPLSEIKIAWNTGVSIVDPDAAALVALSRCLGELITQELREKKGDVYSPEIAYDPDRCSGIFNVDVTSSNNPDVVERRVLKTVEGLKSGIDADELAHFKDQVEYTRLKTAASNEAMLKSMVADVLEGGAADNCDIGAVSAEAIRSAAQKYLPSHKGGYVRAVLSGR